MEKIRDFLVENRRKIAGVMLSVIGMAIGARLVLSNDECEECSEDAETPEE